jgi:uncharacterized membrane protein YdjX (TVP38/TMEM64 family)
VGLVALLTILPLALLRLESVRAVLAELVEFVRGSGALGLAAYVAAYLLGALILVPVWLLSGVAGYAFGFARGAPVALAALSIATSAVFGVARVWLHGRRRGPEDRLAHAVRLALSDGDGAALKLTALLRLAPITPQNVLTYVLAGTPLKPRDHALGTLVGLLPATLIHTYAGSRVHSAAALVSGEAAPPGPLRWLTLAGGLALIVLALVVLRRAARRAFARLEAGTGEKKQREA